MIRCRAAVNRGFIIFSVPCLKRNKPVNSVIPAKTISVIFAGKIFFA